MSSFSDGSGATPAGTQHPAHAGRKSLFLNFLPGLLLTAVAVALLSLLVDWKAFLVTLASIPPGIILLAAALYLVAIAMRGFCWQFLLQRKVGFWRALLAIYEGYFINNILPLRLGELCRAFLLGRRSQLGVLHVLSSIVVERLCDLAIAAGLLLSTLPFALKMDAARPAAVTLLIVILLGLAVLYVAARQRVWVESQVEKLSGRISLVRKWVQPQVHTILDGFAVLTRADFFAASLVFLASSWFFAMLRDIAVIRVFVPDAPFWWATLGIGASNMAGALPAAMGGVGTFEAGATGALRLVGMPVETALAYALVVHVIHLILSSLIGGIALSQEGQTLSTIIAEVRRLKISEST